MARNRKVSVNDFSDQLVKIFNSYSRGASLVADEAIKKEAKWAKEKVSSYKHNLYSNANKYDSSWKIRYYKEGGYMYAADVYNKEYRLTHLLENGHWNVLSQNYTREYEHIVPTQEAANEKFYNDMKRGIENDIRTD